MSFNLDRDVTEKAAWLVLAGVAMAAGAGLLLWRRRAAIAGQQSRADEVEAHPS